MQDEKRRELEEVKNELGRVSPSFCLAKWTTVTMHLQMGMTHSCHHPTPHMVSLNELAENFTALHNTEFKMEQRRKMLRGERPAECEYCWNIEDLHSNDFSDRVIKSSEPYSRPHLQQIVDEPNSETQLPTYLEVSFSNACQFKCSYCSANNSSTWADELAKFGNYPTYSGMSTSEIIPEAENPYVEAFWKWWPKLKPNLHTFRITGGEPLLATGTFRILEDLLSEPEPELNLVINTNLGVPEVLIEKFISIIEKLLKARAVKSIEIYTSAEAHGARAEYIRHGLKYEIFWTNLDRLLAAHEKLNIKIMSTFNALSVTSYIDFLKKVIDVNRKYQNGTRVLPLYVDISYLRYPKYQSVQVLPETYLAKMKEIIEFVEKNLWYKTTEKVGMHDLQLNSLCRIYEWMKAGINTKDRDQLARDFKLFFAEHDRRRGTDFVKTFPEMKIFWEEIDAKI